MTLSSAGRLASGWSLPLEGEEASSSGRLAGFVWCVGEADMASLLLVKWSSLIHSVERAPDMEVFLWLRRANIG